MAATDIIPEVPADEEVISDNEPEDVFEDCNTTLKNSFEELERTLLHTVPTTEELQPASQDQFPDSDLDRATTRTQSALKPDFASRGSGSI